MLYGSNPRFPWEPSTAMQARRLAGTTGSSATDRDEYQPVSPAATNRTRPGTRPHPDAESSRTQVRLRPKAPNCRGVELLESDA